MGCWLPFVLGFCIKLGLFPFHYWVPCVMITASYVGCFVVAVVQKIGPFWLLRGAGFTGFLQSLFVALAILTAGVGAIGGVGLLHYRPLLGYSSLVHSGWITLLRMEGQGEVMCYLIFYSIVLGILMRRLLLMKVYRFLDFTACDILGHKRLHMVVFDFISLAGIPPFLGSVPKMLAINILIPDFPVVVLIFVFFSMIRLYYYMSVVVRAGVPAGMWAGRLSPSYLKGRHVRKGVYPRVLYSVGLGLAGLSVIGFLGG